MTKRVQLNQAMRSLIEATYPISDVTGVPVETLIMSMLAATKPEHADSLLDAAKFFEPLRQPLVQPDQPASGLGATSPRFKHMLTLIQRDNPALYKKLTGLD